MAELIVETGPRAGTRITLNRDEACTIGSSRESALRIEAPGVEREHCVIKALKDGGFGIKALAGEVRVDGSSIQACRLGAESKIEIAGSRLRFLQAAPGASQKPDQAQSPAQGQEAPQPAKMLGGFRLMEVLGKGGWGTVYRAEQVSLHRQLAVKVLNKDLTKDPVFVARFVAEARAAARLSHPNVVQVFDVGHVEDTYFYSMEIMQAGSLEHRLKQKGKIPVEEALTMLADATKGLAFAESMRIVHRDIKPDNLMIDQHGTVKIVDLGLAMSDEDEQTKIAGTPHFMSPEQAQRKPLDNRSDLYSLGCTFYRLMTGKTPFSGATSKDILKAQVTQAHEPASRIEPSIPQEVSAILDKLLQKDPANRFQTANELLAAIEAVLTPPTRKGLLVAGIAVALVVAGAAIWYAVTHKGQTTVVEKTIKETDVEGQRAKKELAAADAREALAQKNLSGLALADALDALVKEHPETKAATKALEESKRIRAEVADAAKKSAARIARLQETLAAITRGGHAARSAGDFAAAGKLLDLSAITEDLRTDPALVELVANEKKALAEAASAKLSGLVKALEEARSSKNAATLRAALSQLEAALDDKTGWPQAALPERAAPLASAAQARNELQALEKALASEAEKRAWRAYAEAAGTALASVARLEFAAARASLEKLKQDHPNTPQAARALLLGEAIEAAARFHQRWAAELSQGKVTLALEGADGPGTVTAFAADGDRPGLTVSVAGKPKAKTVFVPRADLKDLRWLELFSIPADTGDARERAALVGLFALADHLRESRVYLGRLKSDDDASGTGPNGYPLSATLPAEVARALSAGPKDAWSDALRAELDAASALAQGLRALSERRNLTAASWLERVNGKLPDSLVARTLQ